MLPIRTLLLLSAAVAATASTPGLESAVPAEARKEGIRADEWRELLRGSVVVRGRTASAESPGQPERAAGFVVVGAPWDTAYRFLARHELQPEYSRCTKAVAILDQREIDGFERVKSRETHKTLWITMRYTVDYVHDPGQREIRWALDPTARNDVADNRGSWRLIELGPDRSLAVYRVTGIPGKIPRFMLDYFVRKDLPRFLRTVRARVEAAAGGRP